LFNIVVDVVDVDDDDDDVVVVDLFMLPISDFRFQIAY
jgi:hypothetical protein